MRRGLIGGAGRPGPRRYGLETGIITLAPATALLENELKAYLGG